MTEERGFLSKLGTYACFALPATFFFITVILLPFAYGIVLAFTDWDGISSQFSFVGLRNFSTVLVDKAVLQSFGLTFGYVAAVVVLANVLAFGLAYLLTTGMKGRSLLRVGFFTPNLIGGVILGFLWSFLFSNVFIRLGEVTGLGLFSTSWLGHPQKAFWALVLVTVWQKSGYLMIIYIAGIVGIPHEVLEAARIDGAAGFTKVIKIVLPLVMPSIVVCLFLMLQKGFMVYELNLALTNGGPYGSTELVSMNIYRTAFVSEQYGAGQAQAFLLFVVVATIALLQVHFTKRLEVEL